MKKSELLKEMQISATDFNRLATARGVEIKGEYTDEEVAALKSGAQPNQVGATTFPHPAQSEQPETTAIDITGEVENQGAMLIELKDRLLTEADRQGCEIADQQAVALVSGLVRTMTKRQKQINRLFGGRSQNLNAALQQVSVQIEADDDEDDADFFGSAPTFSAPTQKKSLPAS